jgi:hypothetical protein
MLSITVLNKKIFRAIEAICHIFGCLVSASKTLNPLILDISIQPEKIGNISIRFYRLRRSSSESPTKRWIVQGEVFFGGDREI